MVKGEYLVKHTFFFLTEQFNFLFKLTYIPAFQYNYFISLLHEDL